MIRNKLLTKREILILLKYHKLGTLKAVATTESISPQRVRQIISYALRKIREAARITSECNSINFESISILKNMAYDSNVSYDSLNKTISEWIIQGLESYTDSVYWEQISHNEIDSISVNLFDFIHEAYYDKIHYYWKEKL